MCKTNIIGVKNMVIQETKGHFTEYRCDKCGKILVVEHDFGSTFCFHDCEHYYWESVSETCYYERYSEEDDVCDPGYIDELERNSVLTVFESGDVYFLLPRHK